MILEYPVVQGRDLLDEDLLRGVLLVGREVDLLLDTIGGQRTLVLEVARGDVVIT